MVLISRLLARGSRCSTLVTLIICHSSVSFAGDGTITIDSSTRHQIISGWEATATISEGDSTTVGLYADEVIDEAVNDLGINRLRVEVKSGAENRTDFWTQRFVTGQINQSEWRCSRYSTVNDNNNPSNLDRTGFVFSELDWEMETVVLPMKQRLEARGEKLYINLNYVAFTDTIDMAPCQGLTYLQDDPEEYAELVLATVDHLDTTYGIVPDSWEILLEPDNVREWDGRLIGQSIVAAAARLRGGTEHNPSGYDIPFVAPANARIGSAISYFDALAAVPGAADELIELSYHRYCGASVGHVATIASRAASWGIGTGMLEHIGSGYQNLHDDLEIANNSAWQQFTLAFPGTNDPGGKYYLIDESNPQNPVVILSSRAGFLRQYFRYVRANAQRIGASSTAPEHEPLAFENANGTTIVTVLANASGTLTFDNLPPATYGTSFTTSSQVGTELPRVQISAGQPLQATMPGSGVLTVYDVEFVPEPGPVALGMTALTVLSALSALSRRRWRRATSSAII